jgi:hypothetical protein
MEAFSFTLGLRKQIIFIFDQDLRESATQRDCERERFLQTLHHVFDIVGLVKLFRVALENSFMNG